MSSADAIPSTASASAGSAAASTNAESAAKVKSEPDSGTASASAPRTAVASETAEKARELLPILHDVVRAVERDNADTSAKNKDSLEAMNKVKELHRAIEAIREDIHAMPGIERSKSDQLKQLQALRTQIQMKKRLVAKYKDINLKVSGLAGN